MKYFYLIFSFLAIGFYSSSQEVVRMEKINGVYFIPCKVNGLNLRFIFDTGASDVSISLSEAVFMIKNGYISEDDLIGSEYYRIANGDISEGTSLLIKELKIGSKTLYDVKASIVHTLSAPLLLGQSALEPFGSIYIDYNANTLLFGKGDNEKTGAAFIEDITIVENSIPQKKGGSDLTNHSKVKSYLEIKYTAVERFGEIEKGEKKQSVQVFFDMNGNEIESRRNNFESISSFGNNENEMELYGYNLDDGASYNYTHKYDANGNMLEWNWYTYTKDILMYKNIYKYDANEKIVELNRYFSDGSLAAKSTYNYNANGNIIETYENSFLKYTYNYDANGNIIEMNRYLHESQEKVYNWTFEYDANGNIIEWSRYNGGSGGYLEVKYTYKYDQNVTKFKSIRGYSDGSFLYNEDLKVVLNKMGNWVERNRCSSDHVEYYLDTYIIALDRVDNEVERNRCSLDYKYTYKFALDEVGNWVEKIEFLDGIPLNIIEREYEYYK